MPRKYRPATFDIPAEMQLKELKRRENAKCAAEVISESLMLLFAYEPHLFSDSVKRAVLAQAKQKCPASLEAWIEHWDKRTK